MTAGTQSSMEEGAVAADPGDGRAQAAAPTASGQDEDGYAPYATALRNS